MWNIIVCTSDPAEREEILEYVRRFCAQKNQEVSAKGCKNWPELFDMLRQAEPDIIVIAQNGVDGLNLITSIHLPHEKFIWFSDLDFGVQAYRLCLSWFGKKPVTYQKMQQALGRCMGVGE
ncbi:hypothetical protein C0033_12545 [Clostridium sp. chh4-2]|uniref:hypothetical protein n=1 Tax=Clostridium sp. chh4-2 TaxID=2067550 RepID=UPI000CCEB918|nr:hypothetical protein [Clostridium sp. chh4-2]PNV59591.1 hypothetical protein C0033_22895 [Clostridium sp. chh4-2]PNV61711.1 hypothetical protein C0033_12545 [Clostridium sp. chh4-2]